MGSGASSGGLLQLGVRLETGLGEGWDRRSSVSLSASLVSVAAVSLPASLAGSMAAVLTEHTN